MIESSPLFRAVLYVLTSEQGGRKTPFRNGYRPQFYIDAVEVCTSFLIQKIIGMEEVPPGATVTVEAILLAFVDFKDRFRPGLRFLLREGNRTIAEGLVEGVV